MSTPRYADSFIRSRHYDNRDCPNVWPDDYVKPAMDIIQPDPRWEHLREPHRVDIDFYEAIMESRDHSQRWRGMVREFRSIDWERYQQRQNADRIREDIESERRYRKALESRRQRLAEIEADGKREKRRQKLRRTIGMMSWECSFRLKIAKRIYERLMNELGRIKGESLQERPDGGPKGEGSYNQ